MDASPPFSTPDHALAHLDGLARRSGAEMARLMAGRVEGMRGTFAKILGLIPQEGLRGSRLAELAGTTKQTMGEHLRELEDRGWVASARDPADGRARIVRRTSEGDRVCAVTEDAIAELEVAWAAEVGADRYQAFREVLRELGAAGWRATDPTN